MSLDLTGLEAAIEEQARQDPFSGTIMVRESGQTVYAKSFGYANRADLLPNTLDTRFGIASGAKIFAAVAICQLVEQGLLTFDTRLSACLDISFPNFDPAITVHHLLTHTSGIPDYFDEEVMDDFEALWQERPVYTMRGPADFLPMFQDQPMKFAPGQGWSYSNAGFILLGLIVERVSGLSYREYVQKRIFEVAGMSDSGFFAMDRLPARTAYGYIPAGNGEWRTNIFAVPVIGGPDGGAFTTVGDMAKFWEALASYRLLGEPLARTMLSPLVVAEGQGPDQHYGYGVWVVRRDGTVPLYYVIGEDPGAAFYSAVYPAKNIQYTIAGNISAPTWPVQKILALAARSA